MSYNALASKEVSIEHRSERVHRFLGLIALTHENGTNDEYLEQQIVTELAESLDAEMGTHGAPIQLGFDGNAVYSQNGDNLTASLCQWKDQWLAVAAHDDTFAWFAGFASAEADELADIESFNSTANVGDTIMVVAPFPEEAYANPFTRHTVEDRGFQPKSRRSFVRIYEKTASGVDEHIQSFDSSSVALWNHVLLSLGQEPVKSAQDLLERRTVFNDMNAISLITSVSDLYDDKLFNSTGLRHMYGRNEKHMIEANAFVRQYPAIIRDTIRDLQSIDTRDAIMADKQAEQALYKSKALLDIYSKAMKNGEQGTISCGNVSEDRMQAGASSRAEGKKFYGCSGGTEVDSIGESDGSILASLTSFSIDYTPNRKVHNGLEIHSCVKCPMCGGTVDAVFDPKSKIYSCVKKSCKGYNEDMVLRSKNISQNVQPEKSFGELLAEFIFGDSEKASKQKR